MNFTSGAVNVTAVRCNLLGLHQRCNAKGGFAGVDGVVRRQLWHGSQQSSSAQCYIPHTKESVRASDIESCFQACEANKDCYKLSFNKQEFKVKHPRCTLHGVTAVLQSSNGKRYVSATLCNC